MMRSDILEQAKAIRATMDKAGEMMTDEQAIELVDLYQPWMNNISYLAGDRRRFQGLLYKCLQNHTSQLDWTPDVAVSIWTKISNPAEEFPAWIQPAGGHNAYNAGDKVSYNNKHWISTIDDNVWEPGVYGWEEVA